MLVDIGYLRGLENSVPIAFKLIFGTLGTEDSAGKFRGLDLSLLGTLKEAVLCGRPDFHSSLLRVMPRYGPLFWVCKPFRRSARQWPAGFEVPFQQSGVGIWPSSLLLCVYLVRAFFAITISPH